MPKVDFKEVHDKLTVAYYQDESITKDDFIIAHAAIWLYLELREIQQGQAPDYYVDEQLDEEGNIIQAGTILRSDEILTTLNDGSKVLRNIWKNVKLADPADLIL